MRSRGSVQVFLPKPRSGPAPTCAWVDNPKKKCACANPRWRVRATVHVDPLTGKEHRKNKVIRAAHNSVGRRAADEALAELITEALRERRDQQAAPERMTVTEAIDRWIAHNAPDWAGNTLANYELARKRIDPALGTRLVAAVTVAEVERWYGRLKRDGIGPATVQQIHKVLCGSFSLAVRWGAIHASPMREVQRARVELPDIEVPEPVAIAAAIEAMLASDQDADMGAWLLVAGGTGIRPGEQAALRWSDVDLETGEAVIRRVVRKGRPGEASWVVVDDTKTKKRRRIGLPGVVVAGLEQLQDRQRVAYAHASQQWDPHGYVFPGPAGTFTNPRLWYQRWTSSPDKDNARGLHGTALDEARERRRPATRDRYGLPGTDLYLFRHAAATFMVAAGHDPRSIAEQLGNSQPVLLDRYSHRVDARVKEAAGSLEQLVGARDRSHARRSRPPQKK